MKITTKTLAGVLAAQVLLAVVLSRTGTDLAPTASDARLLALDAAQIDRLTIEGPDNAKVALARRNGQWLLPDAGGDVPADTARIDALLQRAVALRQGLPVATSDGAAERFKVADDRFERRIRFAQGDKTLGTLLIGTSQGARQTRARVAGDKAVREIDLASYDLPTKPDDWLDKKLLAVPQDQIAAIELDGLKLTRNATAAVTQAVAAAGQPGAASTSPAAPTWKVESSDGGQVPNADAVSRLVSQLSNLQIDSLAGREASPGYGLDMPALSATITRTDGSTVSLAIGKRTVGDGYVVKGSQRPEYFQLAQWNVEPLLAAAKRDTLLASGASTASGTSGGSGEAATAPDPSKVRTVPLGRSGASN